MTKFDFVKKVLGITASSLAGATSSAYKLAGKVVHVVRMTHKKVVKAELEARDSAKNYDVVLKNYKEKGFDFALVSATSFLHFRTLEEVPPEIIAAYEAAYPREALQYNFIEKVNSLDTPEQILGFSNGIKGKLFELDYVNYLNSGGLPDGYTASIAEKANQPGHDVLIEGPDGNIAEVVQLKATESVAYIQEALHRYPDIHVVTTEEVFLSVAGKELLNSGAVSNSGISDVGLEERVADALESGQTVLVDSTGSIPAISLMLIIAHETFKKDKSLYSKSYSVGERGFNSFINAYAIAAMANPLGFIPSIAVMLGAHYVLNCAETNALMIKNYNKIRDLHVKKISEIEKAYAKQNSFWSRLKKKIGKRG